MIVITGQPKIHSPVLGSMFVGTYYGFGGWDLEVHHVYDKLRQILYMGNGGTSNTTYKTKSSGDYWVVSPDRSEIYVFNSNNYHVSTKDAITGITKLTFSYNGSNQLSAITDQHGNSTTIQYTSGNVSSITGPYGQVTDISVDANGYISEVTNPASESYEMTYTSGGLLLTIDNPNGVVSTMTYNSDGLLLTDSSSAGSSLILNRTVNSTYDSVSETSDMGRVTTNTIYTTPNFSRSTSYPVGITESFTENYTSLSTGWSTNTGFTLNQSYQSDVRFLTGQKLPLLTEKTIGNAYRASTYSEVFSLSDANDPFSFSSLVMKSTANSKVNQVTYNPSTKVYTYQSPMSKTLTVEINSNNDVVETQDFNFTPVDYTYDLKGRISNMTQGTRTLDYTYDSVSGLLASIENNLGETTSFEYDLAGRMTKKTLPDSREINFTYDSNGNLASVTPPGRPMHEMQYNGFDLISSYFPPTLSPPSTVSSTYYYNDDKQLTQITRPNGQTIQYTYGSTNGQLNGITLPTGSRTIYYNMGIPWYSQSEDGVSRYETVLGGLTTSLNYQFYPFYVTGSNTYNNEHLLSAESINIGTSISKTYDNDNLIITSGSETITRNSTTGLPTKVALGSNEINMTYSSSFGELASITAQYGSTVQYSESITRDAIGRVSTKTVQYGAGSSDVYAYTYDSAGRLTDVDLNSSPLASYSYDDNSNRTSQTISSTTTSATYDDQDRILTFGTKSFVHNANGEMTSFTDSATSKTTTYTYDVMGNLKSVTLPSSTVINYKVDAYDQRISKSAGSTVIEYYLWNATKQLIALVSSSNALVARFVYGTQDHVPDYMIKSGVNYQIVTNHLGSPVAVVNSSTGVVVQEIKYDEFGKVTYDSNPGFIPFGFAGCLYDQDTKLCHFKAREYDASIGRWLSKDPILFAGGDTNLYGYVMQDPINLIDPSGLFPSSGAGQMFMPNINDVTNNAPKSIQSRIQDMIRIGQEQDKVNAQRGLLDPASPNYQKQLQQLNKREGDLFDRLLDEMNIFNNLKEPRKGCQA